MSYMCVLVVFGATHTYAPVRFSGLSLTLVHLISIRLSIPR